MKRIGGWGGDLRRWKEDVWKMVNKILRRIDSLHQRSHINHDLTPALQSP